MIYLFIWVRVNLRIQPNPVKTGRKLNVYKMFGRRPGRLLRLLNVLCMFNLRSVSTGERGEIRTWKTPNTDIYFMLILWFMSIMIYPY